MRVWVLAAVSLTAACGTTGVTDGGVDAAAEGCSGSANLVCCASCLNDVKRPAICNGGTWQCPMNTVTEGECASTCTTSPFCTYLPRPECVSCDGTTSAKVCNDDAGRMECRAGTYDIGSDGGACSQDASTD